MKRRRPFRRGLRWAARIFLLLLVADLLYLTWMWPDWDKIAKGPVPRSQFISSYEHERVAHKWPKLRWQPVAYNKIPRHVIRAVLVAEDARFYTHSGFDLVAIREAWDYNVAEGRFALGASTISQQTAKNLFLSSARTPLRKWHELLLTFVLERKLTKHRILEIYLNSAEFGRGVYGVEAAAHAYWGVPVSALTVAQAAELAATLPGPTKHNPAQRTEFFEKRSKKILAWLGREFELDDSTQNTPLPARDDLFFPPPSEQGPNKPI